MLPSLVDPDPVRQRRLGLCTWALVGVAMVLLLWLTQVVERTPDECNYQLAGQTLVARQPLAHIEDRFQGPLILLGTQLTGLGAQATSDDGLRRARIGMLVFPLLLLVVAVAWTRAALGARAGLWVAFLAATSPQLLAFGPLLSSDVAYTAVALLAAFLLWRWLRAPGTWTLLAFGGSLGAVAATKYTGLLTCIALLLVVAIATLAKFDAWPSRGGAPRSVPRRWLGAALALVVAGVAALGTLYAAYLFASPPFAGSNATLASSALQAIAKLPLGTSLLALLPEPLVLGIDYQMQVVGQTANGTFGDTRGNHWAYYPVTVLCKTPVVLLLLASLGVVVGLATRRASASRWTWTCALLPPALLLLYCSVSRSLQMGIRYVLPVVPAMWMLAAFVLVQPWPWRRWLSLRSALGVLVVGSSLVNVAVWPHYIGFWNGIAGGAVGGYRLCGDSNSDWNQRFETGRLALQQRHPDLTFLRQGQGPRFGRVAVYVEDLAAVDPRDLTRLHHWLRRFEPFDRDGAAWFAYDITPLAFDRAIAAGDVRAAEDMALAYLAVEDFAAARAALDRGAAVAGATAAALQGTRHLVETMAAAGSDRAQRHAAAIALATVGHYELALAWIDRQVRSDAVRVFWLLVHTGQPREAVAFLDGVGSDGSRTIEEVVFLAAFLCESSRYRPPDPMQALQIMQRGPAPSPDSPWHGPWQQLEARVQAAAKRAQELAGR